MSSTLAPRLRAREAELPALDRAVAALSSTPGRLWWRAAWGSVLGLVVSIGLAAALVIAWFVLVGRRDLDTVAGLLNIAVEGLTLAIALWLARPMRDAVRGWGESLGWTRPTMGDLRSGALWALANLGIRSVLVAVIIPVVPKHVWREGSNTSHLHHLPAVAVGLFFIGAVLVAPIAEETVFRGVLLRAGMRRWSFLRSALLSSLIFGAFHSYEAASAAGAVILVLNMAIFGMVQCLAARRTGRLAPCAIAHGLMNALVLSLALA